MPTCPQPDVVCQTCDTSLGPLRDHCDGCGQTGNSAMKNREFELWIPWINGYEWIHVVIFHRILIWLLYPNIKKIIDQNGSQYHQNDCGSKLQVSAWWDILTGNDSLVNKTSLTSWPSGYVTKIPFASCLEALKLYVLETARHTCHTMTDCFDLFNVIGGLSTWFSFGRDWRV